MAVSQASLDAQSFIGSLLTDESKFSPLAPHPVDDAPAKGSAKAEPQVEPEMAKPNAFSLDDEPTEDESEESDSGVDQDFQESDDGSIDIDEQSESPQDDLSQALEQAKAEAKEAKEKLKAFEQAVAHQQAVAKLPPLPPIVPYDKLSAEDQAIVDQAAQYYGRSPFDVAYDMQREGLHRLQEQRRQAEAQLVGVYREVTGKAEQAIKSASEAELQHLHEMGFVSAFNSLVAHGAPADSVAKYVESSLAAVKALTSKQGEKRRAARDINDAAKASLKRSTRGEMSRPGASPLKIPQDAPQPGVRLTSNNDPLALLNSALFGSTKR